MSKATKPQKIYRRSVQGVTTFIVTAAQNATGLNIPFIRSLEQLAEHRSAAAIYVIPYRYKNPTSNWNKGNENDEWWDHEAAHYLCNKRKRLNKNLTLMGDIPIAATSPNPLSDMDGITRGGSGIFGHPRVQLRSVARTADHPRIITTTGSCTLENYTNTSLGKRGEHHHTAGATIVELRGKLFHMRQINATEDGSFVDRNWLYTPRGWKTAPRPLSLNVGDTHVGETDPEVDEATFGVDGIVETYKPQYIFFHDLFNGTSCNPHTKDNYLAIMESIMTGSGNVRAEVEAAAQYVVDRTPKGSTAVIVPSNHNDWLTRWCLRTSLQGSGINRAFLRETDAKLEAKQRQGVVAERLEAFSYWLEELLPKTGQFRILGRDESFKLAGVETLHGDAGINGGKGSLKGFSKLDVKVTFGHTHQEGIEGGAFNNGTSTRIKMSNRPGYCRGPGSQTQTHTLQYFNGKRTLIRTINGEYQACLRLTLLRC